jgi:hypothetical protein
MSDRSPRCRLCGRLAVRLDEGYCSARCRSLADAGYASPTHVPAALAAPSAAVEARVLVPGTLPDSLPRGCAPIARAAGGVSMVRVCAEDWQDLDGVLAELRETSAVGTVEVFTLQQFTPGGLVATATGSRRERQ